MARDADPAAEKQAQRKADTLDKLCDDYLADAEAGRLLIKRSRVPKKASTLVTDRGRIARHIKPLLGRLRVAAVTDEDVRKFMHDVEAGKTAGKFKTEKNRGLANVRGGKGTASRALNQKVEKGANLRHAMATLRIDGRKRHGLGHVSFRQN